MPCALSLWISVAYGLSHFAAGADAAAQARPASRPPDASALVAAAWGFNPLIIKD